MDGRRMGGGAECGGEEEEGGVGGAEIAGEEVGENGAGGVEGRGRGVFVLDVPGVFEAGERRCAVAGAEEEVAFGFVGVAFCRNSC